MTLKDSSNIKALFEILPLETSIYFKREIIQVAPVVDKKKQRAEMSITAKEVLPSKRLLEKA